MITQEILAKLITAASFAPSADNMQPWEFKSDGDTIEVYVAASRLLPTDVNHMFTWVSIGAAIQNICVEARANGLVAAVSYCAPGPVGQRVASIRFTPSTKETRFAQSIAHRCTNRSPYDREPLNPDTICTLNESAKGLNAGLHWTTKRHSLNQMAHMDAHSSYIRLAHRPLHDELFSILRFNRKDILAKPYGLDFSSLEVPSVAVFLAKQLRFWVVNQIVSAMGIGRLVAKRLASRLRNSGALCLITASDRDPFSFMEAGRAMEQVWLTANAMGISVHPYGGLTQYLNKSEVEPETFLPKFLRKIESHRKPFYSIFPSAEDEIPTVIIRLGYAKRQSVRSEFRLEPEKILLR